MSKIPKAILIFLVITGILYPGLSEAYGLRTGFGKVILQDVPMDTRYSMEEDAQFPLVVENNSEIEVDLKLEVIIPQEGEVQEGYEAIPDTSWITLKQDSFTIEPNGKAETDVIIYIPYDEQLRGRKFHVFIWSHTVGESVGVGINSKLLFSVAK